MKKKILIIITPLIFFVGIIYYSTMPDYSIFNSISNNYGSERNTELQVAVYKMHNTQDLITKIATEHNTINSFPSNLTINLYHSKYSFHKGHKPFYTITINYANKNKADNY